MKSIEIGIILTNKVLQGGGMPDKTISLARLR